MIVIGIDPSLSNTGVVVLKDFNLVESFLLSTTKEIKENKENEKKKNKKKTMEELIEKFQRQFYIYNSLEKIFIKYKPDCIAYEGYNYVGKSLDIQAEVVGAIGIAITRYFNFINSEKNKLKKQYKVNLLIFSPQSVKKYLLGKGVGQKKDLMLKEVYKQYKVDFDDNNICDAFIISKLGSDFRYFVENKNFRKNIKSYQREIFEKTFMIKKLHGV